MGENITKEKEVAGLSMNELIKMAKNARRDLAWVRDELYNEYVKFKPNNRRWINSKQVRDQFSISESTLRRYRVEHKIRFKRINGKCKYSYEDLMKILNQGKT